MRAMCVLVLACAAASTGCKHPSARAQPHDERARAPKPAGELARFGTLAATVHGDGLVALDDGSFVVALKVMGPLQLGSSTFQGTTEEPLEALVALGPDGEFRWVRGLDPGTGCSDVRLAAHGHEAAVAASCSGTGRTLSVLDDRGAPAWTAKIAGRGAMVHAIAFDAAGDVLVAGTFLQSIDIGATELHADEHPGYVASIAPGGKTRWATVIPRADAQAVLAAGDDILVAGKFAEHTTIGTTTLTADGTGRFLARLSRDGAVRSAFAVPGTRANQQQLVLGPDGAIVLAIKDVAGIAVFRVTSEAQPLLHLAGVAPGVEFSLQLDPQGTIVLGDTFYKSIDLGNGPLAADPDHHDMAFVARYSPAGKLVSPARVFAVGWDRAISGLALDPHGGIVYALDAQIAPAGKPRDVIGLDELYNVVIVSRLTP